MKRTVLFCLYTMLIGGLAQAQVPYQLNGTWKSGCGKKCC